MVWDCNNIFTYVIMPNVHSQISTSDFETSRNEELANLLVFPQLSIHWHRHFEVINTTAIQQLLQEMTFFIAACNKLSTHARRIGDTRL